MPRTVFLHVGAPKTGTTYLQDRLYLNRSELSGRGIGYPVGLQTDMFRPALDLIDQAWGGQLSEARGQWSGLIRRLRRSRTDVSIISHEILARATPDQVARAMADLSRFEVHLVYTARDLGRQIPAEWQENVKHRGSTPFKRYVRQVRNSAPGGVGGTSRNGTRFWQSHGIEQVLTRWGGSLPPERIHLVTVPAPGTTSGSLWERFCSVAGIDPGWAPQDSERRNTSMDAAGTTVVRRLNELLKAQDSLDQADYRKLVRQGLTHEVLAARNGQRISLSPRAREWVDAEAEASIAWVRSSGVDVVGDLEDLRPRWPAPDAEWRSPDRPRQQDLTEAAIEALAAALALAAARPDPEESTPARAGRVVQRMRGRE